MSTRLGAVFALSLFIVLPACNVTVEQIDPPDPPGPSCDGFDDEAPGASVALQVKNVGTVPIFLTTFDCELSVRFDVLDDAGKPLAWRTESCGFSCEELQTTSGLCAADACAAPLVIRLAPGGTHDLSWPGIERRERDMPAACYFEPDFAPPTCSQIVAAEAGDYAARVQFWLEASGCMDEQGNPIECACDPIESSCELPWGATVGGDELSSETAFAYPTELDVQVEIAAPTPR